MTSFPHITIDLILYVSVVTDTSFPHITIDLILYVSVVTDDVDFHIFQLN